MKNTLVTLVINGRVFSAETVALCYKAYQEFIKELR